MGRCEGSLRFDTEELSLVPSPSLMGGHHGYNPGPLRRGQPGPSSSRPPVYLWLSPLGGETMALHPKETLPSKLGPSQASLTTHLAAEADHRRWEPFP